MSIPADMIEAGIGHEVVAKIAQTTGRSFDATLISEIDTMVRMGVEDVGTITDLLSENAHITISELGLTGDPNGQDAIVVLRRGKGEPANKIFEEDADGKPTKKAAGQSDVYMAMQVAVPDQDAMLAVLKAVGADPSACLIIGRLPDVRPSEEFGGVSKKFAVMSRKRILECGGQETGWHGPEGKLACIARNKTNLRPSSWLLLDRDFTDDMPASVVFHDVEEWWGAMIHIAPGLEGTGRIDMPSSSSRLLGADGAPVFQSPSSHHFIQLKDADDLPRLGAALLAQAILRGLGYRRVWGEGSRAWSIYDPTTFSWERLSFDGAPRTTIEDTTIAPPAVTVGVEGGSFDSATVETPKGEAAATLRTKHDLTISRGSSGGMVVDTMEDDSALGLDTVVETKDGTFTMAEIWLRLVDKDEPKLRAQTPFRNSSSWAAVVRLGPSGVPVIYDVGPHVLYRLKVEDRVGPPYEKFFAIFNAARNRRTLTAAAKSLGRWQAAGENMSDERAKLVDASAGILSGNKTDRAKTIDTDAGAAAGTVKAEKARSESGMMTLDEALEDMNQRYGVALFGNKTAVVSETADDRDNWHPAFIPPGELSSYMANIFALSDDGEPVAVFPAWFGWAQRNTYEKVAFRPSLTFRPDDRPIQQGGIYNAWQGLAVTPDPAGGDALKVIDRHLLDVMAAGDAEKFEYILDWCAAAIQQPWRTNMPLLVFKSEEEGVGKGVIVDDLLMPIFGAHGLVIDSPDKLTGRFNAHLGWCVMVSINEAVWGGDRQRAGAYKAMITDQYRPLEQKFRDVVMVRNYIKGIISTNEDWFAPVGLTDRRHAIFDCSPIHKGDRDYFTRLVRAIREEGGREAFLAAMLEREVDQDRMREPPKWISKAAELATFRSADSVAAWLHDWLKSGETSCGTAHASQFYEGTSNPNIRTGGGSAWLILREGAWGVFLKTDIFESYVGWTQRHRKYDSVDTTAAFWLAMRKYLGDAYVSRRKRDTKVGEGANPRVWLAEFAPLEDLRAAFGKCVRQEINWSAE